MITESWSPAFNKYSCLRAERAYKHLEITRLYNVLDTEAALVNKLTLTSEKIHFLNIIDIHANFHIFQTVLCLFTKRIPQPTIDFTDSVAYSY